MTARGDIDQADAEVAEQTALRVGGIGGGVFPQPSFEHVAGVVHVVEVAHVEACQPCGALLAPASPAPVLRGALVEGCLEQEAGQLPLQPRRLLAPRPGLVGTALPLQPVSIDADGAHAVDGADDVRRGDYLREHFLGALVSLRKEVSLIVKHLNICCIWFNMNFS